MWLIIEDVVVWLPPAAHDARVETVQMASSDHSVTEAATKKPPKLGKCCCSPYNMQISLHTCSI